MNYITSMPQYIPRRGREGKKEGGNKPHWFSRNTRDTRGAYKSCVINGKCYIINAHIFKCIHIYFILQAEIEADTHVSIILLIRCIVESFHILHNVILEKGTN